MPSYPALDISVVICAYTEKRWHDLNASVESVRQQQWPAREIIVVVDHNDALLARIRAAMPDVIAVENHEAPGASGSKNSGAAAARGAIVAFLDDDAVAAPDWLEHLHLPYSDPTVIGVGGSIAASWPEQRPAWFPHEFDWVVGCTYVGMPTEAKPVRNLIGANMSFRREVFNRVGLYTGIGHVGGKPIGGSDPDFCIRVTQSWPQKVLLYEPKAHVEHRVSQMRTRWNYFYRRCYYEGLSKALLTSRVGASSSLSSERTYTLRTLPQGILRGLGDMCRGDLSGLRRAGAIVAGFTITSAGYLRGSVAQRAAS